jgi:predicted secreted protein
MSRKRYLTVVGVVVVAVVVAVLLDTTLANHRLAITSLKVEANWIAPKGNLNVTCEAAAPRGETLSYNWSTDGGNITGGGATVTWTAPLLAGSYNVTVTVTDSHGDEVTKNVTIEVRSNQAPVIKSLVASADWTAPSGSLNVTCDASDPNRDNLSYEWTASGGSVSGTGATVSWTAPQETGTYNITVVVKDGYGGQATRSVLLGVALNPPPTIEKLVVTPVGHTFLRHATVSGCDGDVWENREYNIECIALNNSGELVYNWSCTDGSISGDGYNISWTAPNKISTNTVTVEVTITVIVSDVAGNSVGKSIIFYIPSCTCGSWGLKSLEISF